MTWQNYQIASGWNNEAGYTNIEAITPSGTNPRPVFNGTYYFFVRAWDTYSRGQPRFDAAGGRSFSGFPPLTWKLAVADPLCRTHMVNNYEGQVTIKTTVGVPGVYEDWNAYLEVADPREVSSRDNMLLEFELRFKLVSST